MYSEEIMQQRKVEEDAFIQQQQSERFQQFMRDCIPPLFRAAIQRDKLPDHHAFDEVMDWTPYTERQPRNLIAYGPKGTGKTRAVYAAIRGLVERDIVGPQSVCAVHACDLADAFRANALGNPSGLLCQSTGGRVTPKRASVLFVDDVSQVSFTTRLAEDFMALVDHRYRECLCTVITSQTAGPELARKLSRGDADMLPTVEAVLRRINQDGDALAVQFRGAP